ncbi:MAG: CapA family protein [Dehalococcoidales bacterium]|nr:CapA family protein [Dehalococcoidales bacterium]
MGKAFTVAVTGDSVVSKRISASTEETFLSAVKIVRDADIAFTHLEGAITDYDGPEVYPAAESGWTWLGLPHYAARELKWAGFDLVSHASNHCMDYSYGGLLNTWKAMDEADLCHAGTGKNLGEAREPSYLDTEHGRVALISMSSTFSGWARAGEARRDMKGRPGVNPLRIYYKVDAGTLEGLKQLAVKLGWVIRQAGKVWVMHPSGLYHTAQTFLEGGRPGVSTEVNEDDAAGNLRSVREARRHADWVIVHLHTHEFHPVQGINVSADFVRPFSRECIEAGADIFVANGSHADLRGIELHKNKPIFYDPGAFIGGARTIKKLPADFYLQPGFGPEVRDWQATPSDAFEAREALRKPFNPPNSAGPVAGSVIALCTFGEKAELTGLKLHPVTLSRERCSRGLPMTADAEAAKKIIEFVAGLSSPFGTKIVFHDGAGLVKL